MKKVQRTSSIDINAEPPDNKELKNITKRLKSGKSANDIPTAFLKCALDSEQILDELNRLYRLVWNTKDIPGKWGLIKTNSSVNPHFFTASIWIR